MIRRLWRNDRFRWIAHRLLVAAALYVVLYTTIHYRLMSGIREETSRLRALDIPIEFEQVPTRTIDPSEDAAPLYRAASEALVAVPVPRWVNFSTFTFQDGRPIRREERFEPLTVEEWDELGRLMEARAPIFDLIEAAHARPACSGAISRDINPSKMIGNVKHVRSLVRALVIPAFHALANGDENGAVERIEQMRGVLRWASERPVTLIGHMVYLASNGILLGEIENLTPGIRDPESLRRLNAVVRSLPDLPGLAQNTLQDEGAFGRSYLRDWLEGTDPFESIPFAGPLRGLPRLWILSEKLAHLRFIRRLAEAPPTLDGLDAAFEEARESIPRHAILMRLSGEVFHNSLPRTRYRSTMQILTRWGIALHGHRLTHGSYPERLEDLDPAWREDLPDPVDPNTGEPFLYGAAEEYRTLYSTGLNRKDEGGNSIRHPWMNSGDDVTFRLPE